MELLIIGICLGYLLRGTNNKVGCIRRTGPETGSVKPPRIKEGPCRLGGTKPLPDTDKPRINIYGTKPTTKAKIASEMQPPIPPPVKEVEEGVFFRSWWKNGK